MLDRSKVMRGLRDISDKLFIDTSDAQNKAREVWATICNDATFIHKVRAAQAGAPWLLPTWQGQLDEVVEVEPSLSAYQVLSVDGSQIYPDRHQGTACYLINIGAVLLRYGMQGKAVQLTTEPSVYIGQDEDELEVSAELVNCKRQELEFVDGLAWTKNMHNDPQAPLVLLIDGSLIFWHLESKDQQLKNNFITKYLASLHQFYMQKTLLAGYISLPKNKELVNLIRLSLCNFKLDQAQDHKEVDQLVDTTIAYFFLKPYTRSGIFKNNASICKLYPEHLQPYFFYVHVGTEIGRVEIPAWIAQDATAVNLIATVIIDQSTKGRGYPVAIAEAHEQAVVKGPDREFFYQLINKIGFERNQRLTMSQKSIKKRGMGI